MASEVNGKFYAVDGAGNLYLVNPVTLKANISDLSVATQDADGLLSAADKVKIDGIDALTQRVASLEALLTHIVGIDENGKGYIQEV